MEFSFETESEEQDPRDVEFADVPDEEDVQQTQEITEAQVDAGLGQEASPDPSLDALDLECEKRFEVAMYYRTLLKDRLFHETTEAARVVEAEARAFFKERLETLLGIRQPKQAAPAEQPFNAEEVTALKAVAQRVLKKPELAESKQPAQPTLRQARAPTPVPQRAKPAKTSVPKPAAPRQPAVPVERIKVPKKDNGVVGDTGEIIKKGNKVFKVVQNSLGTTFKQDITGQGNPVTRLPMPTGHMMSQVTEMQAARQIAKLDINVEGHHVGVQALADKVSEG